MIDVLQAVAKPMQNTDAQSNRTSQRRDTNSTDLHGGGTEEGAAMLEVLIVHEDMPTGLRAKQVLDRLADELGMNLRFVMKLWTFDALRDPLLRGFAASDASKAHILFLSLHGHDELPLAVRDLINRWIADREEQYNALVVSLDKSLRESASANAVLDYLCTKTVAGRVDMFPHFAAPPPAGRDLAPQVVPVQNDMRQMAPGASSLHETVPRWGLNE